jgi:hypothetical protein
MTPDELDRAFAATMAAPEPGDRLGTPPKGESEYLSQVYAICHDARVLFHHCRRGAPGSIDGFPDLVLVGTRGVLFREIKASFGDDPSRGQTNWIWQLRAAGQDAGIWTVTDLLTGIVADEIALIA